MYHVTRIFFTYFLNLLKVRYNFAKFHHCRTCGTDFREGGLFAPPPFREQTQKSPCWIGLKNIQAYSGIFNTLCNSFIFTTLPYSEPWNLELEAYLKPYETFIRHIQNIAIVRTVYPSIIQPHSGMFITVQRLHIQKPGIFRILEYWEPSHNCILTHTQNPVIFGKIGKLWVTLEM